MTRISDIVKFMEENFPPESALGFDNPGMLVCDTTEDKEINKVMLVLDATSENISKSVDLGVDMMITHHPMIFGGIKSVNANNPQGKMIVELIRNSIPCYAAHTNLDANDAFSNGLLAKVAGGNYFTEYYGSDDVYCGVFTELDTEISLKDFIVSLRMGLDASGISTLSLPTKSVRKIFVQGGSFDEDAIPVLLKEGVDTVVSGEIKHHIALLLEEYNIASVIAGHNATERIFMSHLAKSMQEKFSDVEFFVDLGNEKNLF